ncbi:MAG: FHA domain-containing protein [Anaerolineae bacterium]|nr:FHA domain-containing protein [Anaerolineae bacterium]
MPQPGLTPYLTDPSGQEHLLSNETTTIGRAAECDIVITSKRVSREHARIIRQGRSLLLEDLGSTNSTFLNDEHVLAPVELVDGDQIAIGEVVLTIHDPDATSRDAALPDLRVDLEAGVVRINRRVVTLSPKEFALLAYLYQRRGQVCSKDEIGQAVWPEYQSGIYDYQIENLVRRLRTRIEIDPANPQLLFTMRGLGYKLITRDT